MFLRCHSLLTITVVLSTFVAQDNAFAEVQSHPNIIWVIAEDLCPDFGCYGNIDVRTPNIDSFASKGCIYRNAYATSPVCSPSRSALITGMYQTSIGAHHHRSHRTDGFRLAAGIELLPETLRKVGYFSVKVTELPSDLGIQLSGKEDWNFQPPEDVWDSKKWSDLKSNQPFFAQFNFGEAHRPYQSGGARVDPEKTTTLPPYIADHLVARRDWAKYLETLQRIDEKFGKLLRQLDADGLLDNSIVMFFGDNGREDFRGKSTAFKAGSHVPLVVRWPDRIKAGTSSNALVSLLDVHASTCLVAGAELPDVCHGIPLIVDATLRRDFVFTARDRIETAIDRVRTVQDARYRYIRNFIPDQPHLLDRRYYDRTNPVRGLMRELNAQGKLSSAQAKVFVAPRPNEELYNLVADPFELDNLAVSDDPTHQSALRQMRSELKAWMSHTKDMGYQPEPATAVNSTRETRKNGSR